MKLAASVEGETQKGPNFVPSSSFLGINSVVLPVVLQLEVALEHSRVLAIFSSRVFTSDHYCVESI